MKLNVGDCYKGFNWYVRVGGQVNGKAVPSVEVTCYPAAISLDQSAVNYISSGGCRKVDESEFNEAYRAALLKIQTAV